MLKALFVIPRHHFPHTCWNASCGAPATSSDTSEGALEGVNEASTAWIWSCALFFFFLFFFEGTC